MYNEKLQELHYIITITNQQLIQINAPNTSNTDISNQDDKIRRADGDVSF